MGYKFNFNDMVVDIITGYVGKVTAVCEYFDRKQRQYLVETVDDTGRPVEQWDDEDRLERVQEG